MKRVLITGGAGFIGSNLTRELLKTGQYHVTCIDNFDSFYSRHLKEDNIKDFFNNKNYNLVDGDIRNNGDLNKIWDVNIIVHLAAKAGVRQSIQNPLIYQDVNVAGTHNILEFAKYRKVKQFVFASSSSVYGISPNIPWNEEEKLLPISPYASSKLSDEMLGHVYSHLHGIRFIALRFFTVYGPAQRPDLAIHKFFDLIMKKQPIPVFGDGNTIRDYTYIDDIVKGIKAAMEYDSSDYEEINLGNNTPISLNALIGSIENVCGEKAIINRQPEQPGDVAITYADITKAQKLLGYQPKMDLNEGLRSFYNWLNNTAAYTNKEAPIIY